MKYVALFFLVTLLAVLQSSVFFFFPVWGVVPNYLILFVVLYLLLEKEKSNEGLFVAGISGFWFDVFSGSFFGIYIIGFLVLAYLFKLICKKYIGVSSLT